MASSQLTIILPDDLATFVAGRVVDKGYADGADVVIEALELMVGDEVLARRDVEQEALAAYAAYRADPTSVFTSAEVLAYVRERREPKIAAE